MKRVTVWIDCRDEDVQKLKEKVETFLESSGVRHTILKVDYELAAKEDSK